MRDKIIPSPDSRVWSKWKGYAVMHITPVTSAIILISLIYNIHAADNEKKPGKPFPLSGAAPSISPDSNETKAHSSLPARVNSFIGKTGLMKRQIALAKTGIAAPSIKNRPIALPDAFASKVGNSHNHNVVVDDEFGTPRYIAVLPSSPAGLRKTSSRPGGGATASSAIPSAKEARNSCIAFLNANKELLKIADPEDEFSMERTFTDDFGLTHVRCKQIYKGLEVWGKEAYVHFDNRINVSSLTGRLAPTPASIRDVSGRLDSSSAIAVAVNDLSGRSPLRAVPAALSGIAGYEGPTARKIIRFDNDRKPRLVWLVNVRSGVSKDWRYFIDAQTGSIPEAYNNVCYDGVATASGKDLNENTGSFGTYRIGDTYYMVDAAQPMFNAAESRLPDEAEGAIVCLDLRNKELSVNSQIYYVTSDNNSWNDPAAVSAHLNAITTYNYFRMVYNRNSIDDEGMTIYSIVHVADDDGQPMENAFWAGKWMSYGDGGTYFKPLAGGLDIAAHEMTHGVTQYSANLEYRGQSGALNESISDIFGAMVDSSNWKIGERIIKDLISFPSGAMRDMANPHNGGSRGNPGWQPMKMSEFVNTADDNGGVHINSGIPNYAFYLLASSIGRADAGKIWYRALTVYLTRSSQFVDARIATAKSAADLFGDPSDELKAVEAAWDSVGVFDGAPEPETNPGYLTGDNWVLVSSSDPRNPHSLYMTKPDSETGNDIFPLGATPVFNKPAVSDTSGIILFIDTSHNLRGLRADPAEPEEVVLDSSGCWWSVAMGPGLNSFAMTTTHDDTAIHYMDLADPSRSKLFKIRTPSFDGADAKTAVRADALSFDPTGRYILFDTYNMIRNASGDTVSFWNINLLDITTGDIESVFPPQPEGISVGNPSFSRTSPMRFAFDYFDEAQGQYAVMTADFNTGDVGIVDNVTTSGLGFPTFSGDDRTIAYHTIQSIESVDRDAVLLMPLKENMLEGTGNARLQVQDAKYPVWFVIGSRIRDTTAAREIHGSDGRTTLVGDFRASGKSRMVFRYRIPEAGRVRLQVFDIRGREIAVPVDEWKNAGAHVEVFTSHALTSGTYVCRLRSGGSMATARVLLGK